MNKTGFSLSQTLLRIKSSSCSKRGTFRSRSRQRWRLMSLRRPSGRLPTMDSSSIPRVAAHRQHSCCLTRTRSRCESCLRRIHHSRSRFLSCISDLFEVIDCRNTCKDKHHNSSTKTCNQVCKCSTTTSQKIGSIACIKLVSSVTTKKIWRSYKMWTHSNCSNHGRMTYC